MVCVSLDDEWLTYINAHEYLYIFVTCMPQIFLKMRTFTLSLAAFQMEDHGRMVLLVTGHTCACPYTCVQIHFWLQLVVPGVNDLGHFCLPAVIHNSLLHHRGRDQSQSIHLHRQIYSCVVPSAWTYEDHSCVDFRFHFIWERGSQFTCNYGYDRCCYRNGLVWQRLRHAGREGTA